MPAGYRYLIEDVMSGIIVADDLPLNDVRYDDALNRPGSLSASLAMSSRYATLEILREGQVAVYVERDGRIDWGGLIWEIIPESGQKIAIGAEGWLGYWDHRTIRKDVQFDNIEQFTIAATLLTDAQDEVVFGDGYDLGIPVTWDALSGVTRDRLEEYRPWKAKNLGEAIRQLAAVENGFDFAMSYQVAANRINKAVKLYYPRKGRDTQFLFEYDTDPTGQPVGNIVSYRYPKSAASMAWAGDGWGDGADETRLKSSFVDETKRGVFPPFDAAPSFTGVTIQSTLDEHTEATFASSKDSRRVPIITVNPDLPPKWGDFLLGDTARVIIHDGFVQLDGSYRIVGYQIEPRSDRPQLVLTEA
jgi:hypothetical protein